MPLIRSLSDNVSILFAYLARLMGFLNYRSSSAHGSRSIKRWYLAKTTLTRTPFKQLRRHQFLYWNYTIRKTPVDAILWDFQPSESLAITWGQLQFVFLFKSCRQYLAEHITLEFEAYRYEEFSGLSDLLGKFSIFLYFSTFHCL